MRHFNGAFSILGATMLCLVLLSSLTIIYFNFLKMSSQSQVIHSPPAHNNPVRSVENECKLKEDNERSNEF